MKFSSSIVSTIAVLAAAAATSIVGTTAHSASLRHHHHEAYEGITNQDHDHGRHHHHHHHRHRHLEPLLLPDEDGTADDDEGPDPICADGPAGDAELSGYEAVIENWTTDQQENHRKLGGEGPAPLTRIDLAPWKNISVVFVSIFLIDSFE